MNDADAEFGRRLFVTSVAVPVRGVSLPAARTQHGRAGGSAGMRDLSHRVSACGCQTGVFVLVTGGRRSDGVSARWCSLFVWQQEGRMSSAGDLAGSKGELGGVRSSFSTTLAQRTASSGSHLTLTGCWGWFNFQDRKEEEGVGAITSGVGDLSLDMDFGERRYAAVNWVATFDE